MALELCVFVDGGRVSTHCRNRDASNVVSFVGLGVFGKRSLGRLTACIPQ
jgi:hypothetical protein